MKEEKEKLKKKKNVIGEKQKNSKDKKLRIKKNSQKMQIGQKKKD